MQLHRGAHTFDLDELVRVSQRIDALTQDIVRGLAVQIAVGLRQRDELRCIAEVVENQKALPLGQMQIGRDLRNVRGALSLFFGKLRVDDGSSLRRRVMRGPPLLGSVQVYQINGNLFLLPSTLRGAVDHYGSGDPVGKDYLITAVF